MFLTDIIGSVFRPSIAALAISIGLATFTMSEGNGTKSVKTLNVSGAVCNGVLAPVCAAFSF